MAPDLRRRWASAGRGVRLGVLCVIVIGSLLAGAGITHSPLFSARTITVTGTAHLTEAAVLRLADVHPGTNVFYLDTDAVRKRLVADPWVAGATVVRHLPSSIEIAIREVRPVGVSADTGGPQLLAQDGSWLGAPPSGVRLPVIVATGGSIGMVAGALGSIPSQFLARIDRVTVGGDGSITLTLRDSIVVMFGDGGEAARKAQALRAVLAWAKAQPIGVVSVDVSSPGVPTARLRGATAATAIALPAPTPSGSKQASGSSTPSR